MRRRLVFLSPIQPCHTGNGLAMRCEWFRRAAALDFDVRTVVVPVAGRLPGAAADRADTVVVAADHARLRVQAAALVADPVWRGRLAIAGALPAMAQAASPAVADAAVQALGERDFDALHVMRAYLAPLGAAVSERLGIRAPTLDLDEDDAALATAAGDLRTAEAYGRLLDAFGPLFDRCSAASAAEAQTLAARHGLDVQHISNAVECPPQHPRRAWKGGAATVSMLFVGNLTYRPNVEAARVLVSDILPRVRRLVQRPVGVTLVGPSDGRLAQLCAPEVQLTGFVPDLEAVYGAADVAVMALSSGAGTRIKLLEAFAHGVPVVASPVAASGLEVSDGEHLLLAGDAGQAAAGVAAIVAGRELAERLVQHAGELVRQRYCTGVVIPAMRDFIARRTRADARVVQSSSSL